MRPTFFDFPEDENCYKLNDQYMFDPDILFAPIVNQGQTEREVYLPEDRWIRASDKKAVDTAESSSPKMLRLPSLLRLSERAQR